MQDISNRVSGATSPLPRDMRLLAARWRGLRRMSFRKEELGRHGIMGCCSTCGLMG